MKDEMDDLYDDMNFDEESQVEELDQEPRRLSSNCRYCLHSHSRGYCAPLCRRRLGESHPIMNFDEDEDENVGSWCSYFTGKCY